MHLESFNQALRRERLVQSGEAVLFHTTDYTPIPTTSQQYCFFSFA